MQLHILCEKTAEPLQIWDTGVFAFAGDETAISVSGKDYKTANRII